MITTEREAVRAIVLTPEREVLLMRIHSPDGEHVFWIAPGGGLQAGETIEQALKRELQEELGLQNEAKIGILAASLVAAGLGSLVLLGRER